eukprot:3870970-Prymnesium_polylepis.1
MQGEMMVQFQRGLVAGSNLSQGKSFTIDSPSIRNGGYGPERRTAVSRISRLATFARGAPAGERDSAKK